MKKLFTLSTMLFMGLSMNAQVTFTALSGSAGYTPTEGYDKLFDGTADKWCTGKSGAYFIFQASEAITLTGYAMRTGSDDNEESTGYTNLNRNPKSWTIYGSNDDVAHGKNDSWTLIKQVQNNEDMDGEKQKTFYFEINNNFAPYKYYKVTIEAIRGNGNDLQISEFIPSYRRFSNPATGVAGGDWWHDSDPWQNMFDGNLTSRWCCGDYDSRNYLIFDAGSSIQLTSYMLVTGTDTRQYSGRNPTGWKICGSNDQTPTKDGNWTTIVNVSGNTVLEAKNNNPYVFDVSYGQTGDPLSSAQSFRYYKFEVVGTDTNNDMFQLNEIVLNPKTVSSHVCSSSYTYSFAGGETTQQVELCDICNKTLTSGYKYFTLKDGKIFHVFVNGWGGNGNFTYTRSVSSPVGTVCLPYSMDAGSKTDADYYTLAFYNSTSDIFVFDRVTGVLAQRTPAIYVLKNQNGTSVDFSNHGSAVFGVTPSAGTVEVSDRLEDGWSMVGTLTDGTASESDNSIYYYKGGNFYRCNETITYKPYRAYITGPDNGSAGVKAFSFSDEMEDAINDVMVNEDDAPQLYDLNGRKVNRIRNGEIYILNGKKVMFNK